MANTTTLSFTSELMTNYVQAEIMSPESTFVALQTNTGNALLFSIGTDGVFYATEETSGQNTHGWVKADLSTQTAGASLAGALCTRMAASQNLQNGSLGLGMVLTLSGNDHLYLCLNNSNSDTTWLNAPAWVSYPFDAPGVQLAQVQIVNVFISETNEGQFIVADIVSNPGSTEELVGRYYIDTSKSKGYAWNPHALSIDLNVTNYLSKLGRTAKGLVDGMYTGGQVDGSAQLIYSPLYNAFDANLPALPSTLQLPGGLVPEALATCRNTDGSTDLYVTAGGTLYYFAAGNQMNGATGVVLFANTLFTNVTELFAISVNGIVTVWGLNSAGDIFYSSCSSGAIQSSPPAWSLPVPILTGVDLASPYTNLVNNGNTIFAVAENELYILTKSPETSIWSTRQITLPAISATAKAESFSSYTTRVQLTDGSGQPLSVTPVSISASTRMPFFVNNLYTVLDTTPVSFNTDQAGSITLIEAVTNVTATQLTVTENGGSSVQINPMDKPFQTLTQLNTPSALSSAQINYQNGSSKPLVAPGTSADDLQAVATANQNLASAYNNLSAGPATAGSKTLLAVQIQSSGSPSGSLAADFGDVLNWLESGVEHIVTMVKDALSDAWHFVVTIAGDVYTFVLDCIEKVVGAAQWIFAKIVAGIEDLINFLKYLFDLDDIARTKAVFANLFNVFINQQIAQLSVYKQGFDSSVAAAEADVAKWAGISWGGLGEYAGQTPASAGNSSQHQSATTSFLSYHLQNNADSAQLSSGTSGNAAAPGSTAVSAGSDPDSAFAIIQNAYNQEQATLQNVVSDLNTLINSYSSLTLTELLEKLIAILAEGVLGSVQVIVDALLEFIITLSNDILDLLNTPITIPVVSDILSDFGVPTFSVLDIICWVAAVPATIIYKIANNEAPFGDNAQTTSLKQATDFTMLLQTPGTQTGQASQSATGAVAAVQLNETSSTGSGSVPQAVPAYANLFSALQIASGSLSILYAFINALEATSPNRTNGFSIWSSGLSVSSAVLSGTANILAPNDPIQGTFWKAISDSTLCFVILNKLASFCYRRKSALSDVQKEATAIISIAIDMYLTFPGLMCSIAHFVELSDDTSNDIRTVAILGEAGNVTSCLSRIMYAFVTLPPKVPEFMPVMLVANLATGGLHLAQGLTEPEAAA